MRTVIAVACVLAAAPLQVQAQFTTPVPGYGYAPGETTPHALDPCARPGIAGGLARLLNAQARLPKHILRFENASSPDRGSNADTTQSSLTCHGTLVFADGQTQTGIVLSDDPNKGATPRARWKPDCWGKPYYQVQGACPATDPAAASTGHWSRISHSDDSAAYVSVAPPRQGPSTNEHPTTIEVVDLIDFNSAQSWGAGPVWSVKSRVRFDCSGGQLITIDHTSYSAHMASGDVVAQGDAGDDWHAPQPGTVDDFLFRRVCKPS